MSNRHALTLLVALSFIGAIFIGWITPRNPMIGFIIVAIIFGITTLQIHGYIALTLLLTTISSAFILPLSGRPYLWEVSSLFTLTAVPSAILFRRWPEYSLIFFRRNFVIIASTIMYCLLLALLMIKHGAGLRILGSQSMGARFYLQQIIMIFMPLCAVLYPLSKKVVCKLFIVQLIFAFTFVISEMLLRFQPPGTGLVLQVLDFQTDTILFAKAAFMGGISRYQSIGTFSFNLTVLILVMVPIRKFFTVKGFLLIPLLFVLLILCGLGGSRRTAIEFISIIIFTAWSQKALGIKQIFLGAAVIIGTIILIYMFSERLPYSIQRTFSFLPGIEINAMVKMDANATMHLRRDLRAEALLIIKDNFWTGMGFALDPDIFLIYNPTIGTFEEHALTGRFYSGPLGIFATLGVFAFSLFCILHAAIFSLSIRMVKMARQAESLNLIHRITFFVAAQYYVKMFIYVFITGDASNMLKAFIPIVTIMLLLERILYLDTLTTDPQTQTEGLEA